MPLTGGFLLVSNHLSYLDPVAVGIACRRKLNYMARADLFVNPFFATLLKLCQVFPVKRNTADHSALKEALARLKDKKGLLVFPEGTRAAKNNILRPQAGVGFLAYKSGVPIIPVLVKGTDLALPRGAKFFKLKKIEVCFGEKFSLERGKPNNYQTIADEIMQRVRQLH